MPLNDKQLRFRDEYLIDLNATQAAIRAGYSEKTAYSQGQRLLKDAEIQKSIAEAQEKRSKRTEITQDRVLQELASIGFSDIRGIFEGNRLLSPDEWPDGVAAAIAGAEFNTKNLGEGEIEHVAKLKLWDKNKALEKLAHHLGLLKSDMDVNMPAVNLIINTHYDDSEDA